LAQPLEARDGNRSKWPICCGNGPSLTRRRGLSRRRGRLELELATLRAAVGWWRRRGWLTADPTDELERRRERIDRTRALTRGQLERLFARRDLPLRERTLWLLLYETAARANEPLYGWPICCLDHCGVDVRERVASPNAGTSR
jgi:site-specific recombinase XerC